ncbi:hypothetical protein KIN20_017947 [Parelaphostrongylus tenuis]|uniref:Uncharacterized protein n=1 Tax=Parelaphostrongylus tenuis TaxID=148309 RepID=A0AAD5N3P5_PARTN|nr:hypothetical protein KIN20_017947 [Parelaphostrongylus tenuis]
MHIHVILICLVPLVAVLPLVYASKHIRIRQFLRAISLLSPVLSDILFQAIVDFVIVIGLINLLTVIIDTAFHEMWNANSSAKAMFQLRCRASSEHMPSGSTELLHIRNSARNMLHFTPNGSRLLDD